MRILSASALLVIAVVTLYPGVVCDAAWSPIPSTFARRQSVTTVLSASASTTSKSSNKTALELEQRNWAPPSPPHQEGDDDDTGPPTTTTSAATTTTLEFSQQRQETFLATSTPEFSQQRQETISRALLEARLARERAEREQQRKLPTPTPRDLINQAMKEKQQTKQAPAPSAIKEKQVPVTSVEKAPVDIPEGPVTVPQKERLVVPQIKSIPKKATTTTSAAVTQSTSPFTNPILGATYTKPRNDDPPKPVMIEPTFTASITEEKDVMPTAALPETMVQSPPMPEAFSSFKPEPVVVVGSTFAPSKDTTTPPPAVAIMSESVSEPDISNQIPDPASLEAKLKTVVSSSPPSPPIVTPSESVVVVPADNQSPTLFVGDNIPVQAAVLVDNVLDQVDSSKIVGDADTVTDAIPFMVTMPVEVPTATSTPPNIQAEQPTPTPKKADMSDLIDKLPKIEIPKMDISPEAVEQAAKLAKMTAQAMVQGATYAFKEGYEFALQTKNSLNTTMVEEMDITYEEALTKVSRGFRGFVMICVLVGDLVKETATVLAEDVKATNAYRQQAEAQQQAGANVNNAWVRDEFQSKTSSVFGDLVASASSALDQVKAQAMNKDSLQEFAMPSSLSSAMTNVEMDTPEDSEDDEKMKVPYFLDVVD
jgi:hypothetical protein